MTSGGFDSLLPASTSPASTSPAAADDAPAEPSAIGQAVLMGMEVESVERQIQHLTDLLKQLRQKRWAWAAGGRAEQRVVQVLVGMDDTEWHVLPDRRWPGTRRANIDVIVVGPAGAFVIDVKNWRDVTVRHGRLWHGDADADEELVKLLDQTAAVEQVLVDAGLPPTEVVPLLVLAGRRDVRAQLDRVTLVGERDLTRDLVRRGVRLTPDAVERLVECLDRGCPPMPQPAPTARTSPPRTRPVAPRTVPSQERAGPPRPATHDHLPRGKDQQPEALVSREELLGSARRGRLAGADRVVDGVVTSDASQADGAAVVRSGQDPGSAGTGKTVVALHRARYLAARGDRVLFTSFVRTLGLVNKALLTRMAPEHAHRVDFATVHGIAAGCLRELGLSSRHQQKTADTCFGLAWERWGRFGTSKSWGSLGVLAGRGRNGHQRPRLDELRAVS